GFEGRHAVKPTPAQLSGLAPLLLDAAAAGDGTALRIVSDHGATLAAYAEAAARRVGLDVTRCRLVLTGGVFRHRSSLLRTAVLKSLGRDAGGDVLGGTHEPAVGALLLALEAQGVRVEGPVLRALESSLPPSELYAT
ncbi:MAG TPA: hypothetical protein VFF08_10390, partial [Trueperaceae bacterium]|nr:hypothetical protein [Trueperaceae bacterium]